MTLKRRHTHKALVAPRALPTPTHLGRLIAMHAGPLSLYLPDRNVQTGNQVSVLSQAINDRDDARSCEAALKIAQMDPSNPDAIQLVDLLRKHAPHGLN
ncbi:hypothetical protein Q0M94_20775 (plasmid) [Deinococcus radiomollis]|uniref:hypothetical protein n=1 Tax=Deinococcus radiomollis TaxID=468916 RepID=UPI00389260A3